jgi:cell division protein FtsL
MLRLINALLAGAVIAGCFALYAVKLEVRQLDAAVQADERRLERLYGEVAVLRAERALLARPDRIETLARAMGLAPIRADQIAVLDGGATPPGR